MKNILKIAVSFLFCIILSSCTNDKDNVVSANGFQLRKVASVVSPEILLDENASQVFAKLEWDRANNGVPSASTYVIVLSDHDEVSSSTNSVESTLGLDLTSDARNATLTVGDFNTLINELPTFNCNLMNIDIRIKSKLGVSSYTIYQYSNPITIAVKGFPKTNPVLAFVKDATTPDSSAKIAASDYKTFTNYEGYMYLESGDYKFHKPDACGDYTNATVYGISGGSLVQDGTTSYTIATSGHYIVKANLIKNTFTITPYSSFGIFGDAKGVPTGVNKPMTYNSASKKWELTFDLFKGKKFKFRAVNGTTNLTVLGGSSNIASESGTDIKVPGDIDATRQKYDIKLDVSNPRAYTYELILNPN